MEDGVTEPSVTMERHFVKAGDDGERQGDDTAGIDSLSCGSTGWLDLGDCLEMLRGINSIILRWDNRLRITFINDFGLAFFGYRCEDLLGRSLVDTLVPGTSSAGKDMMAMLRDIVSHPERYVSNENENILRDGTRVWISWTNRAILDDGGKPVGILSVGNDITRVKRAEDRLEYQLARTQAFLDALPMPVFYSDAGGMYKGCNREFERLAGLPRERIIGRRADEVGPEGLVAICRPIDHKLLSQVGSQVYEGSLTDAAGARREVIIDKALFMDADGTIGGQIGAILDITGLKKVETELRQAREELETRVEDRTRALNAANESLRQEIAGHLQDEAALRDSEARFRRLVDSTPISIAIYDRQMTAVLVNRKFVLTFGYTLEDLPSLGAWWPLAYPDLAYRRQIIELWEEHVRKAGLEGGEIESMEAIVTCKDGILRQVYFSGALVGDLVMVTLLDVTDRKRVERALQESERKFRAIFDQTFEFIGLLSVEGILLEVNRAALRFAGLGEAEVLGMSFWETSWWTHSSELQKKVRESIFEAANGEFVRFEVSHVATDDSLHYYDFSIKPVKDETGRVVMLIPESRDITEMKLAEKALKESEARLNSIFRAAPTGIGLVANRIIREANVRLCEMVGRSREELLGQSSRILYPTQEEYDFVGREKYRMIAELGTGTVETRWLHCDGHILDVLLSSTPVDPEDLTAGVTFTALDITERQKSEKALKESEENLRLAIDGSHMGMWSWNLVKGELTWSERCKEIFGVEPGEGIDYDRFLRAVHPEDRERADRAVKTALEQKTDYDVELRVTWSDGSVHWVAARGRGFYDAEGRVVRMGGTALDITGGKRSEEALKEAKARAELYLDLMSHDIINMNQAIMGYLELLNATLAPGEVDRELIDKPIEIIDRSTRLIGNVKKLTMLQAGTVHASDVDLCEILKGVKAHHEQVPGREVTLSLGPCPPGRASAGDLVRDVFENLVENSIRHSAGPVSIALTAHRTELNGKAYYRVEVADTGPGIPDDLKKKIFLPQTAVEQKTERRGFGLYLVRTLIDYYHGKVWVEDRVPGDSKQGCRFVVLLPAA